MYRQYFTKFLFILISFLLTQPLLAQSTTGNITGAVTDSTGAVVTGATVTVVSTETGAERTATTNENGNYSFQQLQPGT